MGHSAAQKTRGSPSEFLRSQLHGALAQARARLDADGRSPLELTFELHARGLAPADSAARVLLDEWRATLLALAMGTHRRLGQHSELAKLAGMHDVFEVLAAQIRD